MAFLDDDWTYDGSPDLEPRDEVRELVGDTDKNEKQITDTTIALALEVQSGNVRLAAAVVAEKIGARFAKEASSKSGKDYSRTINRSDAYFKLADRLRKASGGATPEAAQLRVSTAERIYADGDLRKSTFRTGMFLERKNDPRPEILDQDVLDSVRNYESEDE